MILGARNFLLWKEAKVIPKNPLSEKNNGGRNTETSPGEAALTW